MQAAPRLLAWYASRERTVPGRDDPDPYRVWVAEVMAQQTRITTVASRYSSFLERFPDVRSLAGASLDDVLKAWEGLGYYGRARNLHRAARRVCEEFGGELPSTAAELRELPGVGPYTAGAIASIAFGEPEPAVDGNARRVLSRLYDLEAPGPAVLEGRVRALISAADGDASGINQALMDLGSSVCLPRSPRCGLCPVRDLCRARAAGTVEQRPPRRSRSPLPHRDVAAALVWRDERVLIARRPAEGLLGGLWEFPGGGVEAGETPAAAAAREVREETGVEAEIDGPVEVIRHAYSHFRITLHLFRARWLRGGPPVASPRDASSPRWALPAELDGYAFPAANQQVIARLVRGVEIPPGPPGRT